MNLKTKTLKDTEKLKGYRYLRNKNLDDSYFYVCEQLGSVGRTITYLTKKLKQMDKKNIKAYYITNVSNLCFKSKAIKVVEKYKNIYSAGSITKGPFTPRSQVGFFKKLLRNNLRYKKQEKDLFKKICILTTEDFKKFKISEKSKDLKDDKFVIRKNYFGHKIKLGEVIKYL